MIKNRTQLSIFGHIEPSYPVEWANMFAPMMGLAAGGKGDSLGDAHNNTVQNLLPQIPYPGAPDIARTIPVATNTGVPSIGEDAYRRQQQTNAEHDAVADWERRIKTGIGLVNDGTEFYKKNKDAFDKLAGLFKGWWSGGHQRDESDYAFERDNRPGVEDVIAHMSRTLSTGQTGSQRPITQRP